MAFGALNDLIGVWTSCFMLLFVISVVSLVWMHLAIRSMDQTTYPELAGPKDLPEAEALRDAARLPRPNAAANARAATPAE